MKPLLTLDKLTVKSRENGKILLKNVGFQVAENEIHCILGKNGSGKSTVAYAIMGMDRLVVQSGKIFFEGKNITYKRVYERARLGMTLAFQEPARFEGLSVGSFLKAGSGKSTEKQLAACLKMVGLPQNFLDRTIDEKLSGGERKRIEIASVIAMQPKLIIMDEPDASLDIIVYNEFYDLLLRIKDELKCSILLITHREEAGLVADSATLIDQGKIIKNGTFREVMGTYCERMGRRKTCLRMKKYSKIPIK